MAAVASGAIWVRLVTAVATAYRIPFDPVYACITWLGWLVPLAIVLFFAPRMRRPRPRVGRPLLVSESLRPR